MEFGIVTLSILLLISAVVDFRSFKIPNFVILTGILLGFLNLYFYNDDNLIIGSTLFVLVLFIGFLIWSMGRLTGFNALGAGDVKLLSILPLFLTAKEFIWVFLLSFLILIIFNTRKTTIKNVGTGFIDLGDLIVFGIPLNLEENKERNTIVSYAPSLLLSYIFCLFLYL